jgi:hypothetical protein
LAYSILWERHGVYISYLEKVTFGEFLEAVLTIHAHPNYVSIKYVIHDMLGATSLDFDSVDMTAMVAHELGARFTNRNVRPVVVSDNPEMQAMTRAFSEMTRLEVGFFASVVLARDWAQGSTTPLVATIAPPL